MQLPLDPAATEVSKTQKHIGLVSTKAVPYTALKVDFTGRPTLRHLYKTYRKSLDRTHLKTMISFERSLRVLGYFSNGHMCAGAMISSPIWQALIRTAVPSGRQDSKTK